jgi:hypothetical protein
MTRRYFSAGQYVHLNFHLAGRRERAVPCTDLQTYLGAFGHTLIMSEDMVDYVHSHPLDILAEITKIPARRIHDSTRRDLKNCEAVPDVTFEGLMPKPGHYRAWTQFRRERQDPYVCI